jgi:hypothetical protein
MKRLPFVTVITLAAAFSAIVALPGCGGSGNTKWPYKTGSTGGRGANPFKSEGLGTLRGTVKLSGTAPVPAKLDFSEAKKEADIPICEKGTGKELLVPDWMVGANNGLENVLVWVRAPAGQYFALSDSQKKPARAEVSIDQPHCAFIPHVDVLFPSYFDGSAQVSTGQRFVVKNSAPIPHATSWEPTKSLLNMGDDRILPRNGGELDITLLPCRKAEMGGEESCSFKCTIHPWMKAYVWVLDHPFVAKTDEEGNFEIKDVPAGDLTLVYWHESFGKRPKTDKIMIKGGDNTKDITISK